MFSRLLQRRTLLTRTLLPISLQIALILGVMTFFLVDSSYRGAYKNLSTKAQLTAAAMAEALVAPVWNVAPIQAEKMLEALSLDPDLVEGSIYTDSQTLFSHYVRTDMPPGGQIRANAPILQKERDPEENIGQLELVYTTHYIEKEAAKTRARLLFAFSLVFIFTCGGVFLTTRSMTKPLLKITEALTSLARGDIKTKIPENDRTSAEISDMTRALSVFKDTVEENLLLGEEQKKLRLRAENEARISSLLKKVAAAAGRSVPEERVLRDAIEIVGGLLDWPIGHAFFVSEKDSVLREAGIWLPSKDSAYDAFRRKTEEAPLSQEDSLAGRAWASGTLVFSDLETAAEGKTRFACLDKAVVFSGIALPITVRDSVRYILEFIGPRSGRIDGPLLEALEEAGHYLSIALERIENETALLESKKAAEAANMAKSDFLANMSHEIRTPMNSILGLLALTLETKLTETQRSWVDLSRQSAEALLGIINDILDLSKIEAGEFLIESARFDLMKTVTAATSLLGVRAKGKGLSLLLNITPRTPLFFRGDALRLRQVLFNLLGNGIKFTEKGYVALSVDWKPEEGRLAFEIEDTGVGIDPRGKDLLFKRFGQADTSAARRFGGTGLGLAISRELISLMGGSLDFESVPGKGTRFFFDIPLSSDLPQEQRPRLDSFDLLVIEEETPSMEVLKRHLRTWNISCFFARQEKTLRKKWEKKEAPPFFDAILCPLEYLDKETKAFAANILFNGEKKPFFGLYISPQTPADLPIDIKEKTSFLVDWPLHPPSVHKMLCALRAAAPHPGQQPMTLHSVFQKDPAENKAAPTLNLDGLTALIVDDQPVNLILMRTILERAGCLAETANNGQEAIEKLAGKDYDVIFMDCQMPGMDGFEATRKIREMEAGGRRPTPVVALTANAMSGDKERCLREGMDDYLIKPVNNDKILHVMKRYARPAETERKGR